MQNVVRWGRSLFVALALPVVLVALWWFLSANSTNYYSPPLQTILTTFGDVWFGERLRADVLPSVTRLVIGYTGADTSHGGVFIDRRRRGCLSPANSRVQCRTIPTWLSVKLVNTPMMYSWISLSMFASNPTIKATATPASSRIPLENTSRSPRLCSCRGR